MRPVLAQARMETVLTLRRGESFVVTLGIPLLFLVFFSYVDVIGEDSGYADSIDFLVPGILALAIISTSMVSVGIATGFDRQYGVLKLIGGSPLGRTRLLFAKITSVGIVEAAQVLLISIVGLLLGWDPQGGFAEALVVMVVGSITFTAIGLLMAGTLRAEATLALANGLYIVFLLTSGIVYPVDNLPEWIARISSPLPATVFASSLRAAFDGTGAVSSGDFVLLCLWAVVFVAATARAFKWE